MTEEEERSAQVYLQRQALHDQVTKYINITIELVRATEAAKVDGIKPAHHVIHALSNYITAIVYGDVEGEAVFEKKFGRIKQSAVDSAVDRLVKHPKMAALLKMRDELATQLNSRESRKAKKLLKKHPNLDLLSPVSIPEGLRVELEDLLRPASAGEEPSEQLLRSSNK